MTQANKYDLIYGQLTLGLAYLIIIVTICPNFCRDMWQRKSCGLRPQENIAASGRKYGFLWLQRCCCLRQQPTVAASGRKSKRSSQWATQKMVRVFIVELSLWVRVAFMWYFFSKIHWIFMHTTSHKGTLTSWTVLCDQYCEHISLFFYFDLGSPGYFGVAERYML